MSIFTRLIRHLLLWCLVIAVELGIRSLLQKFGPNVLPPEILGAVERYIAWLLAGTLMVSATSSAGEVMAIALKGVFECATEMVNDGVKPLVTAIRELRRGGE